jgi:hypothetical protein
MNKCLTLAFASLLALTSVRATPLEEVFQNPNSGDLPVNSQVGVFWFWANTVTKEGIRRDLEEMKQREKALLEESDRAQRNEPLDDFETYITEQVKRAQLLWTYLETKKKMAQMRESIEKTSASLKEKEDANPDYFTRYKERYYQARKEAGLPSENTDESFLKYLGVDILDVPEAGQPVVSSTA